MCGIIGAAGELTTTEEKVVKTLSFIDTLRGPHSTGFVKVPCHGEPMIRKELGTPWDFWDKAENKTFLNTQNKVIIGHNRWATKGAITKENAHPFHIGDIMGVHNGTLTNQSLLDDDEFFEVDSENIIHQLSETGVDDTISRLAGAYALVWYNKKENTINFARNSQRPLFFCYSASGRTLYWASEKWMLIGAAEREGVAISDVLEFAVGKHYKLELGGDIPLTNNPNVKINKPNLLGKFRVRDTKAYTPPKKQHIPITNHSTTGYLVGNIWVVGSPKPVSTSTSTTQDLFAKGTAAELRKYYSRIINSPINFMVAGSILDERGHTFVVGKTIEDNVDVEEGVDVRIFLSAEDQRNRAIDVTGLMLTGVVKKVTVVGDSFYLLINSNKVNEYIPPSQYSSYEEDVPEDRVYLSPTKSMSIAHFNRLAKDGCTYCSHPVTAEEVEAGDVTFTQHDTPIHTECQSFYHHAVY